MAFKFTVCSWRKDSNEEVPSSLAGGILFELNHHLSLSANSVLQICQEKWLAPNSIDWTMNYFGKALVTAFAQLGQKWMKIDLMKAGLGFGRLSNR